MDVARSSDLPDRPGRSCRGDSHLRASWASHRSHNAQWLWGSGLARITHTISRNQGQQVPLRTHRQPRNPVEPKRPKIRYGDPRSQPPSGPTGTTSSHYWRAPSHPGNTHETRPPTAASPSGGRCHYPRSTPSATTQSNPRSAARSDLFVKVNTDRGRLAPAGRPRGSPPAA